MGNSLTKHPSEYNGVSCKCHKSLPPCKKWSQFTEQYICRGADTVEVYVFLGGKYYRIKNSPTYYCNACFWEPQTTMKEQEKNTEAQGQREIMERKEEEQRQRHQKRAEEAQRNLEESVRSKRLMMEIEERKQQMARRAEEAQREVEKQKRFLLEQMERRKQERIAIECEKKQRERREVEYELSRGITEEQNFYAWVWKKEKEKVRQVVEIQTHQRDITLTTPDCQGAECMESIRSREILIGSESEKDIDFEEDTGELFEQLLEAVAK